jgi:hypothetical protein
MPIRSTIGLLFSFGSGLAFSGFVSGSSLRADCASLRVTGFATSGKLPSA